MLVYDIDPIPTAELPPPAEVLGTALTLENDMTALTLEDGDTALTLEDA